MSGLSVFTFEFHQVRFVGTAENPEWVAADVCACLAIRASGISEALASLEDDEMGNGNVVTPGGKQKMLTVTESGLYRLIFKSRKPVAKRFQRWVFHEVLPSIRKTGSYSLQSEQSLAFRCPLDTEIELLENKKSSIMERIATFEQEINDLKCLYKTVDIRQAELYIEKYASMHEKYNECLKKLVDSMAENLAK
ncbi:hypothetical protein LC593_18455 [Nostoc sp. CHAB 5844]|nr:hypothetical protein [Nostoc sp. CHAB 5844]